MTDRPFSQLVRGAHVTEWHPASTPHPVLFSSSIAVSGPTQAWRGGIPICAPWFGGGPDGRQTPSHGPARTSNWTELDSGAASTRFRLHVERDARGDAADLELTLTTVATDGALASTLLIRNLGDEDALIEAALHSYFAVSAVTAIELRGLEECPYVDKVTGGRAAPAAAIEFGSLVDRIYDVPRIPVDIVDTDWSRTLRITGTGSPQVVVWNPGPDAAPKDLGPGEWRDFVCVEAAILGDSAALLHPRQSHTLTSAVEVLPAASPEATTR